MRLNRYTVINIDDVITFEEKSVDEIERTTPLDY